MYTKSNVVRALYERLLTALFRFVTTHPLNATTFKAWTEDDPQLLLAEVDGLYGILDANGQLLGHGALLVHLPSDAHDPTCNEEVIRFAMVFAYGIDARGRATANRTLVVRRFFVNGQERTLDELDPELLGAVWARAREMLEPSQDDTRPKVRRWASTRVQYFPTQETTPSYWTGLPTQPWTFDVIQAHLFLHEADARGMSEILARSAAMADRSDRAVYGHQAVDVDAPDVALH
jgi:hypothetical protein